MGARVITEYNGRPEYLSKWFELFTKWHRWFWIFKFGCIREYEERNDATEADQHRSCHWADPWIPRWIHLCVDEIGPSDLTDGKCWINSLHSAQHLLRKKQERIFQTTFLLKNRIENTSFDAHVLWFYYEAADCLDLTMSNDNYTPFICHGRALISWREERNTFRFSDFSRFSGFLFDLLTVVHFFFGMSEKPTCQHRICLRNIPDP